MVIPLFVGRPKSIKGAGSCMDGGKSIMLVAQKNAAKDEPSAEDIYSIGCIASILQMIKLATTARRRRLDFETSQQTPCTASASQ